MKARTGNLFVYFSVCLSVALSFAVSAMGQGPGDTNRLVTGGDYHIGPPPTNMMFRVSDNPTNAGDDNLVWSHSGRMIAVDRTDPTVSNGSPKYICLLDVRDLGNVQNLGARSSAVTNPMYCNITDWTWNDDRVIFGNQPQGVGVEGLSPPPLGKVRLASCAAEGAVNVVPFLMSDPQGNPTNHIYSPSIVFDPMANKERLLCLVSTAPGVSDPGPNERINLFTATFEHGGVPNWSERVQLTAFNTNVSIQSSKWCPELGTNYQPICNRLEMLVTFPTTNINSDDNRIIIFNDVRGVIANPATAPTSLADPRLVMIETNAAMNSQASWTYDGQYVIYGRTGTNQPPLPPSSDIYSKRADSPTNPAVKFEVPSGIQGGQKQWLCISPDGMKAAFTVDHHAYVIPLQFDNVAVTGAVVTNVLTDASYTAVDVKGEAIDSNTVISIVAPPSVDTNNFVGEFSGYARQFTVEGVSSQFNLNTNAQMTLHFSQSDIPVGASITNLAVYVYNPQGTAGQTGTWDKLSSVINTNLQTIVCTAEHFSVYAIGRASAEPEGNPPNTPSGVSATKGGYQYNVRVSWNAISNATTYQIWRNTSNDTAHATRFLTEPATAYYDDDTAAVGTLYYYWVKAKNSFGASGFSGYDTGYAMGVHNAFAADFDGDAKADPAVDYEAVNTWGIKLSSSGYIPKIELINYLGGVGYAALAADFDGDSLADPAVYQSSTGTWKIKLSTGNYSLLTLTGFLGASGWTALAGDFDGDRLSDPAVYQAATGDWKVKLSSAGYAEIPLSGFMGADGWIAFAADFDGDGKADPAIYQEATGLWGVKLSTAQYLYIAVIVFGGNGWQALGADFDGDGLADPTVFQPATGNWIIKLSSAGYAQVPLSAFLGGLP